MDEDKYGELRPQLGRLLGELTGESARHRIKAMQITSDEDPLNIIKDQGSWHVGYHSGIDYAVTRLKASKLYKDIKNEEDVLY